MILSKTGDDWTTDKRKKRVNKILFFDFFKTNLLRMKDLGSYLNNITRNLFINARANNYLLKLWVKYNFNKSG